MRFRSQQLSRSAESSSPAVAENSAAQRSRRSIFFGTLVAFLALAVLTAPAATQAQSLLYSNLNKGAVTSGVTGNLATPFTCKPQPNAVQCVITQIATFQFNNGKGDLVQPNDAITVWDVSRKLLFAAKPTAIAGPTGPNQNWIVTVNPPVVVLGGQMVLIQTSNMAGWAHNSGTANCLSFDPSFQCGMIEVWGQVLPYTPPPPKSPAPQPRTSTNPYGGNCNGAGCTHPDLRAYGGCAPYPLLPTCYVQVNAPASDYFFLETLYPYTSLSQIVTQCSQYAGSKLMVVTDRYYDYYYIDNYAVFGCLKP